jgi:hypothetical protein
MNLREFINKTILEYYEDNSDVDWDLYDQLNSTKEKIFTDFLYKNNPDYTKNVSWTVIPFPRLRKIWEDYIKTGIVRDESGLEMIQKIITNNILKVNIFTELAGHTPSSPDEDYEEYIGYFVDEYLDNKIKSEFLDKIMEDEIDPDAQKMDEVRNILKDRLEERFLDYYIEDPKSGHARISDYGLKPLLTNLFDLHRESDYNKKLTIIDKILNIVHQRSDIAAWFVEGGTSSLNQLSGYSDEETGDSKISGSYSLSDY